MCPICKSPCVQVEHYDDLDRIRLVWECTEIDCLWQGDVRDDD